MTSPASASFPWPQAPEPPSGEFRTGRLPAHIGGDYLAARGARPGPALLLLVDAAAGYGAVHGLFRLADVLDARRLAGSLLIRVAGGAAGGEVAELLDPANAMVEFERLRPTWRQLAIAGYGHTGNGPLDSTPEQMAAASGATYRYSRPLVDADATLASRSASRELPRLVWRVPDVVEERAEAVEGVFQGLINILRVLGMLEGQLPPAESARLQPPADAEAPAAGFWSPTARPGQRLRIDDRLGTYHDSQGNALGDLLTNVSGILLGISDGVRVAPGQPLAEIARPV